MKTVLQPPYTDDVKRNKKHCYRWETASRDFSATA